MSAANGVLLALHVLLVDACKICSVANHGTLCCWRPSISAVAACRQDIKLDLYDWQEADGQLETKWRVSGIVQLPWRPLLAAAGGTTHVFSQVCLFSRQKKLTKIVGRPSCSS